MPMQLPVVSPAVLERGLRAELTAAYESAPAFWPKVAMSVPSTGASETYAWLGRAPVMREWSDNRVPAGLADHRFTIVNRDWEASLAIDRNALEDDAAGQITVRVRDLGRRAKQHPDELITALLESGESTACYDGQFFFDTDHQEGESGSQSNDLTHDAATPSNPTAAEFAAAFRAARKALRDIRDDRGRPFNHTLSGLVCMVPTSMESAAEEVLAARRGASGADNVLASAAELIINPLLTAADRFYLLIAGVALRPLIFQERRGITAAGLREGTEGSFFRKEYYFGVDARYNAGYGLWQHAVQMKLV